MGIVLLVGTYVDHVYVSRQSREFAYRFEQITKYYLFGENGIKPEFSEHRGLFEIARVINYGDMYGRKVYKILIPLSAYMMIFGFLISVPIGLNILQRRWNNN